MYDLPDNTIYSILQNPIFHKFNFRNLKVDTFISNLVDFRKKYGELKTPESDCIKFYLLNHGFHLIKQKYSPLETLNPEASELVKLYGEMNTEICQRLFFHIASVAHGMLWINGAKGDSKYDYFESAYGVEFRRYLDEKGNHGKIDYIKKYDLPISDFLSGVASVYSFGKIVPWGKPYSIIIKTILEVTLGHSSFQMMGDHAFSLCHNGGTVLNKGIGDLYKVATEHIFEILDVQAAGQMPQWVRENIKENKYIDKDIKDIFNKFSKLFPEEFLGAHIEQEKINENKIKQAENRKKMNEQFKQWWNNPNNQNNWAGAPQDKPENKPPEQKIDNLLIDTFKRNKWIK